MPTRTLMLRGLDAALMARVRGYARDKDLSLIEAAAVLLTRGLAQCEAVSAAGFARAASLSPEERSDIARRAARARWET